jgi:hypothetical protein
MVGWKLCDTPHGTVGQGLRGYSLVWPLLAVFPESDAPSRQTRLLVAGIVGF